MKLFSSLILLFSLLTNCGDDFGNPFRVSAILPTNVSVEASSVTMFRDSYSPPKIIVRPGQVVTWFNDDTNVHTVTTDSLNNTAGGPNSDSVYPGGISPGQKFQWKVPENALDGTVFFYHCRFHGKEGKGQNLGTGMVGQITVRIKEETPVPSLSFIVVEVPMNASEYHPKIVTVRPGDVIRWTNKDPVAHTVTSDKLNKAGDGPNSDSVFSQGIPISADYEWTVPQTAKDGTIWYYHCRFHGTEGNGSALGSGMAGAIMVIKPGSLPNPNPQPNPNPDPTPDPNQTSLTIIMSSNVFTPKNMTVFPGTELTWINIDSYAHTVTADSKNEVAGGPDSGSQYPNGISPDGSYKWMVPLNAESGTAWYYHCNFHGTEGDGAVLGTGMVGVIIVQ